MNGEIYGVTAYSVRNGKRQAFHSANESMGDVVEHFADTFDSNTCLLKNCITVLLLTLFLDGWETLVWL